MSAESAVGLILSLVLCTSPYRCIRGVHDGVVGSRVSAASLCSGCSEMPLLQTTAVPACSPSSQSLTFSMD